MLRLLTIIGALLVFTVPSQAQTYFNGRYTTRIGTTSYQSGLTSVIVTDSGSVACGQTLDYPYLGQATLTLRFFDSTGRQTHIKYHGSPTISTYSPFGSSLINIPGRGFAMPGAYSVRQPFMNRALLWRFNAQGDTLWTRKYPSVSNQIVYAGCRTRDGGFTLFGNVRQNNQVDFLLIRTDSMGHKLWEQTYDRGYYDSGSAISQTSDGGFLLVGSTLYQNNGNDIDTYVVKTDSLGNRLWERTFSGSLAAGSDGALAGAVLRDGSYVVAGLVERGIINGISQTRNILYKLSSQGQLLWEREIGPSLYPLEAYAVHELPDGSLVVGGQQGDSTNATPAGNAFAEGFVYKVCADGDSVWYRSYKLLTGGRSSNYIRDLRPTPDGGFVGAGFAFPQAPDTGVQDGWVFKLDSAGYLQAGGTPPTRVCPRPQVGLPHDEAATQPVAIWPNPAPDGRFTLQAPGATTYTVADALGREVAHGTVRAGENALDLSRHPSGLYLLRLIWPDGRLVIRRLVR